MYITKYNKKLLDNLKKARIVAIDTETKSLVDKTMVGFSVAYGSEVFYVPVRDKYLDNMSYLEARLLLQHIMGHCRIIFHNSSFDIPVLAQFGTVIPDKLYEDTVIIANLIDENMQHGLKKLVKKYFDYQMKELKEICGSGKKRVGFHEVQSKDKVAYACDDAKYTLKLFNLLSSKLGSDQAVLNVYTDIEQPLLNVIAQMHINGIKIDMSQVMKIATICRTKIAKAEKKLKKVMGDINFGSPKQLREYFVDKCHMPVVKKSNKTGEASMDREVLDLYAETNAEAKLLLEFRKYSKIYTTFVPALTPEKWDAVTLSGRIYTSFNQAGTVSGRFSSSRPNMQNIPHEDKELGIRSAIIPEDGHIFIGADYSQIELRVLAHFSQDPNLLRAYQEGQDIHQQTMDAVGVKRTPAKTINFGLVYGMGKNTLAKRINVTPDEAQIYINKFFANYVGIKAFWAQAERQFRTYGYVQTISGRKRRRTPYFFAKDDYDQGAEVRSAINSIIQGTSADIMKRAMITIHKKLKAIGAKLVLTVHDEILVSCPIKNAEACYMIIVDRMVKAGSDLTVPIEVDCKFGRTWAEAHGDGIKLEEVNAIK